MYSRISSIGALALLLAGCGANTSPEPEGAQIACAIGPGAEMTPDCTLERVSSDSYIIHHPGGGFRRFDRRQEDGLYRLEPADGAIAMTFEDRGEAGQYEFALENERYSLPTELLADRGETAEGDD